MQYLRTLLSLVICAVSAALVLYWGGQYKQGQFQANMLLSDPGMLLFFAGPYLLLAATAIVASKQPVASMTCFGVTLALAALGVAAVGSDHVTNLRTPPGRETI